MIKVLHFLFLLCLTLPLTLSTGKSLNLKLMHRDSIHSPLYPGNLTDEEKLQRLHNFSIAGVQFYETKLSRSDYNEERIRPRVHVDQNLFVAELILGTPPPNKKQNRYFFMMDSASGLIWLPCKPCTNSWVRNKKNDQLFDPRKSSTTFKTIPCNHPLCNLHQPGWACVENKCHYTYTFMESQVTKGILASDVFVFSSDDHVLEFMKDVVFGCSNEIQGFDRMPQTIHGILGLDHEPLSLTSQIQQQVGGYQFAYCLPQSTTHLGHLRFGPDAKLQGHGMITIPFVPHHTLRDFYLPLMDVSVGNHRIDFAPGTFEARWKDGRYRGGFIVDSGAVCSYFMSGDPYQKVMNAFKAYFEQYHLADSTKNNPGYDLCYRFPAKGYIAYPSMTFHFQNGKDFIVQWENVVVRTSREDFCVMIHKMEEVNILGAYQQRDHWISFNYFNHEFSFVPADCSRHA